MGVALRNAVLLRGNGMAGGRTAVATPKPPPGKHSRPAAAAQTRGDMPPVQVWARLGLIEMASPASTGTSRASLRRPATPDSQGTCTPPHSPRSPMEPTVLFSPGSDRSTEGADSHDGGDQSEEMALGTTMETSAEGNADDTYMLAMCAMMLMLMLQATGQWTALTGQEMNVKKLLAFAVQHTARGTREAQDVDLNGETLPREHEFK